MDSITIIILTVVLCIIFATCLCLLCKLSFGGCIAYYFKKYDSFYCCVCKCNDSETTNSHPRFLINMKKCMCCGVVYRSQYEQLDV